MSGASEGGVAWGVVVGASGGGAGVVESLWSGWAWVLVLFVVFVVAGLVMLGVNIRLARRTGEPDVRLLRQLVTAGLGLVVVVAALLIAPMPEGTREQILKVLGLVLTAVVAFASTTFVSNAMAGLMLRSLRNFRPGDFLRVGEVFGRVTERGLFHTEVQTEDRDLTTIPNLHLVQNPVTVVHASGTIVSATVGLGYDVGHGRAEALLVEAARRAGLGEPFVQVLELGDHSVTYRAAGFLEEVSHLVSARSRLRAAMLDALHEGGVEVMTPTIMDQRRVEAGARFVPEAGGGSGAPVGEGEPEAVMFDKAEEAGRLEALRKERGELEGRLKELGADGEGDGVAGERDRIEARMSALGEEIGVLEARRKGEGGGG